MKIVVTGGAGFIGSHVVERLEASGHEVLVIDNLSSGKRENLANSNCTLAEVDITDLDAVELLFKIHQPEYAIHLAAQPAITLSEEDPNLDAQINILGTLNVLRAAQRFVKQFVFASTSAVYKKSLYPLYENSETFPDSPYGASKLSAEHYVRLLSPRSVILRFANVFGPRQVPLGENQVIPRMIRHFLFGDSFFIHGNGEQKRDFVYVDEVARAVELALRSQPGVYNIASGNSKRVNDVARALEEIFEVPGTYAWEHDEEADGRGDVFLGSIVAGGGLNWKHEGNFREQLQKTVEWWQAHGR